MADQNEISIKIQAEADKAIKEISGLTKRLQALEKENKKISSQTAGVNDLGKAYAAIASSLKGLGAGLIGVGAAMKGVDFAKLAAEAKQTDEAFRKLFESMGLDAEKEFEKIKKSSMGLISDQAIKQAAVQAASLGVPLGKLGKLMEIARIKSKEMGTSAESAFSDIATGIGRASPMILDNLGLTIKLKDAYAEYAKQMGKSVDELSAQDKQIALTNAVINAGTDAVKRYSDTGLSAKEKMQKFNAEMENLKIKVGG